MNLDKKMNLVIPLDRSDGTTIYVHSTPISRLVFREFYEVIAKTFTAIYSKGFNVFSGPRVAAMLLRTTAAAISDAELARVEAQLFPEFRRLSNVLTPSDSGWQTIPLHVAITQKAIDEDDLDEVENAITFFIVASAVHRRNLAQAVVTEAAKLWGARSTFLTCTEFRDSLPTSTPAAASGTTAIPSSIPS